MHDYDQPSPARKADLVNWAAAVLERGILLDGQVPTGMETQAEKMKTWVNMPKLDDFIIPSLTRSFYNRPVYARLIKKILSQTSKKVTILTGDPGVGKSTLLLRLLFRLAADGSKVLIRYRGSQTGPGTQTYVDFSNPADIKVDYTDNNSQRFLRYAQDPDVWELIDGEVLVPHVCGPCRTVICASPDAQNWRELAESATIKDTSGKSHSMGMEVLHMATWAEQELIEAAFHKGLITSLTDEDELELVRARMQRFGGDALMVLNDMDFTSTYLLTLVSTRDAYTVLLPDAQAALPAAREYFLRAVVDDEDQFVRYELASHGYAGLGEIVRRRAEQSYWPQLTDLLASTNHSPQMAKVLAGVFGSRAHTIGRQGLEAVMRVQMTVADVRYLRKWATSGSMQPAHNSMGSSARKKQRAGDANDASSSMASLAASVLQQPDMQQQYAAQIAAALNKPHKQTVDCGMPLQQDSDRYYERLHGQPDACDALMYDTQAGFLMLQHAYEGSCHISMEHYEHLLHRIQQADPNGSKQVHIVFVVPEQPSDIFNQMSACKFSSRSVGGQRRVLDWSEVPQQLRDIPMWVVRLPLAPLDTRWPPVGVLDLEIKVLKEKWAICTVMEKRRQDLVQELGDLGIPVTGSRLLLAQRLLCAKGLNSTNVDDV